MDTYRCPNKKLMDIFKYPNNNYMYIYKYTKNDFWILVKEHKRMKTNKKALTNQRKILDQRIEHWLQVSDPYPPPSGWIRAVRGALGMSSRQLAKFMGTNHSGVVAIEKREVNGKASLETLQKAAKAMGCRLIYAIIPNELNRSLDEILEKRAMQIAKSIYGRLEHSMRLERQGSSNEEGHEQIQKLASELKTSLDPRLWNVPEVKKKRGT